MRVAQLVGVRRFQIGEATPGEPGPGEVQVRVHAVGICGSDMHAYAEGSIGDTPCVYPMVIGHEPAGTVTKLGAGVGGLSVGDLVACEPAVFCYHCDLCRAGRHNLCRALRFLSMPGEPGFFRELVNLPVDGAIPLPRHLSPAEGALVEPLAVVLHSMKLVSLTMGETAVVVGAGPIGLLTVALLRLAGAGRVLALEPLPHRRELARRMGADAALPADAEGVAAALADSGGRGADVVLDCAAKGDTANQCLDMARPGGRVVYTGIPSEVRVPLEFHRWRRKELALFQVRRSNRQGEAARDLLARERARFAPLLTHERPLERIGEAFALVERYDDGVAKMIVTL